MWSFIVWLTATEWSTVILHACIPFKKYKDLHYPLQCSYYRFIWNFCFETKNFLANLCFDSRKQSVQTADEISFQKKSWVTVMQNQDFHFLVFGISNSKWSFLFFNCQIVTQKCKNKSLAIDLVASSEMFYFLTLI